MTAVTSVQGRCDALSPRLIPNPCMTLTEPAARHSRPQELKKQELAELDAVLAELGVEDIRAPEPAPAAGDTTSAKALKRRQKKAQKGPGTNGEAAAASRPASPEASEEAEEAGVSAPC